MLNMNRMWLMTAAGAVLALVACTRADSAHTGGPCSADLAKHCPNVTQGGGKRYFCLQKNFKSLSPGCQKQIEKRRKKAAEHRANGKGKGLHGPCGSDIQKHCKDVPSGGGKIRDCLTEHKSELSNACKNSLGD